LIGIVSVNAFGLAVRQIPSNDNRVGAPMQAYELPPPLLALLPVWFLGKQCHLNISN